MLDELANVFESLMDFSRELLLLFPALQDHRSQVPNLVTDRLLLQLITRLHLRNEEKLITVALALVAHVEAEDRVLHFFHLESFFLVAVSDS